MEKIIKLINFAIEKERAMQALYNSYIKTTKRKGFRQLLMSMAEMENEHEKKLMEFMEQGRLDSLFSTASLKDEDFNPDNYLVKDEFSHDMEYKDFLILVIKTEDKAENLYKMLESLTEDQDVMHLFRILAEEEKKQKEWVQNRYDLEVLKDG